jgi:hypothetical protein
MWFDGPLASERNFDCEIMNPSRATTPPRRAEIGLGVTRALLWGGLAGALAAAIRFGVIEFEFFRTTCEDPLPLWCWPRQVLIFAFDRWMFGAVSLGLGLYAVLKPGRTDAALAAVVVGAIGLALYNAGPASIGLVFGLVTLARARA